MGAGEILGIVLIGGYLLFFLACVAVVVVGAKLAFKESAILGVCSLVFMFLSFIFGIGQILFKVNLPSRVMNEIKK